MEQLLQHPCLPNDSPEEAVEPAADAAAARNVISKMPKAPEGMPADTEVALDDADVNIENEQVGAASQVSADGQDNVPPPVDEELDDDNWDDGFRLG